MDTDIQFVQATTEHAEELARLNDAVQKVHAENHPKVFKYPADTSEITTFFRSKISTQHNYIFLALDSKRVVGYVWCTIQQNQENPFKHEQYRLFIHQITVATEFRRKGVGRKLLEAIDDIAMKEGVNYIALDSWEFNGKAQAFFEQFGFSRYNVNMWREMVKPEAI